jgi:class 3 adenylate cyclase/tetratricopeptide (TPR) repeat protein
MPARPHPNRELATVLFTDVVDSTRHLAVSGDQVWARLLDALDAVTASEVRRRGGEVVKSTGDGALVLLPSPTAAVDAATALHAAAGQLGVGLRIGVHTGEIERRGLDVAGIAVHVAARLMGSAQEHETVLSAVVQALASSPADLFDDRGELALKGIPEPVRAYAIRHETPAAPDAPAVVADVDALVLLLRNGRFEEAAEVALEVTDVAGVADALLPAGGRTEFLDVDVTLVRMLEDLLDRLPEEDSVRRSRVAAKLAFELRGDPATVAQRRELLDLAARLAEEAGDDRATSEALLATVHARWEPGGSAERLAAADRVIALTRRTRVVDHELEARLARVHALLEQWQVHEAGLELATYARLAARLDRPDVDAFVASRRALLAQISGRYDEQRRQGEIAYAKAVQAGMPDAVRLRMTHRWAAERDRYLSPEFMEEAVTMLRELGDMMPGNHLEADVARALLALGRTDEARTELARALPVLVSSSGYRWLWSAVWLAEVAAETGPDEACETLYDVLLPHQDRLVSLGPTFGGAVRDRLGILALRLGRVDEAVGHLVRAVSELDGIAALPWAAEARVRLAAALRSAGDVEAADRELDRALDTARALGMTRLLSAIEQASPGTSAWSLSRDGEDWVLEAGAERARFRSGRGFEHLATLLANPGRDVSAPTLDGAEDAVPAQSGIPAIDERAARDYRRRLAEIDEEQERADRAGDEQGSARLEEERAFLLAEIRRATGLGGRARSTGSTAERARVNVTRNLKRALDQIQRAAPIAGAHLAASIRTGLQCRYEPAPGGPMSWRVDTHRPTSASSGDTVSP